MHGMRTTDAEEVVEDGEEQLKIEVGANRCDLICPEGIALSLRVFLGLMEFPKYVVKDVLQDQMQVMNVHESVSAPFVS
jgi:hypothetical protein